MRQQHGIASLGILKSRCKRTTRSLEYSSYALSSCSSGWFLDTHVSAQPPAGHGNWRCERETVSRHQAPTRELTHNNETIQPETCVEPKRLSPHQERPPPHQNPKRIAWPYMYNVYPFQARPRETVNKWWSTGPYVIRHNVSGGGW